MLKTEVEKLTDTLVKIIEKVLKQLVEDRNSNDIKHFNKKDGTIVTELDLFANFAIQKELKDLFGNIAIISEENSLSENKNALNNTNFFVLDPIDGTKSFIDGGDFSINLAFCQNRFPVWSIIAMCCDNSIEIYFTYQKNVYLKKNDKIQKLNFKFNDIMNKDLSIAVGTHFQCNDIFNDRFSYVVLPSTLKIRALYHNEVDAVYYPFCYLWDVISSIPILDIFGINYRNFNKKSLNLFANDDFSQKDIIFSIYDNDEIFY